MDEMKKLNHVIYPTFNSAKGLILWIGLFCILLSIGGLLCIVGAPRGIDWRALKIFVGIPFGFIFFPVLLISFSYRIKICDGRIVFYMFFLPVKMILLEKINKMSFEKIASNGQPCALAVSYGKEKYIYPVRLFDQHEIEQLITGLNDMSGSKVSPPKPADVSVFDLSDNATRMNFIWYVIILFLILLFIILFL
ncbi:MAG: hypothetical protein IJT50_12795 [Lentisphaeria bacterium]|nr:hypothetical protein [Lentisphaeria bacterium]